MRPRRSIGGEPCDDGSEQVGAERHPGNEEVRHRDHTGAGDDRCREQEGEARRLLVPEAGEQAAAHRDPGARDAREQREYLAGADQAGPPVGQSADLRESLLLGDPVLAVQLGPPFGTPPEKFRPEEQDAIDDQEAGRDAGTVESKENFQRTR